MIANQVSERLLLTLWVGSLLAIGYLAVPMAFATLGDVTLAGNYASKLFSTVNLLGLGCGGVLLVSKFISQGKQATSQWRFWVLLVMVVLTLVFSCYLQPEIAEIKQLTSKGDDAVIERFDLFHEISRNLYLIVTLLGLALVVSTDKVKS
ncbi:MAG: DUF4149 domain-containing protein [Methylophagaceae bacterium]